MTQTVWTTKCHSKRFVRLVIDPSQMGVGNGGKIIIFVSAEMKSDDLDIRVPHIIIDADREKVKIETKPHSEAHRQSENWPGRGVGENITSTDLEGARVKTKPRKPKPQMARSD